MLPLEIVIEYCLDPIAKLHFHLLHQVNFIQTSNVKLKIKFCQTLSKYAQEKELGNTAEKLTVRCACADVFYATKKISQSHVGLSQNLLKQIGKEAINFLVL